MRRKTRPEIGEVVGLVRGRISHTELEITLIESAPEGLEGSKPEAGGPPHSKHDLGDPEYDGRGTKPRRKSMGTTHGLTLSADELIEGRSWQRCGAGP